MILSSEKKLCPLQTLKPVNMGNQPELSVKNLYKEFSDRPEIMPYMPPKLVKNRTLSKKYFFDIVNTFFNSEL